MDLKDFEFFNRPYVKKYKNNPDDYIFQDSDSLKNLKIFIKKQKKFIDSLSDDEKDILESYTLYGNIILNHVMRNTATIKNIKQIIQTVKNNPEHARFLTKHLKKYKEDSDSIGRFAQDYAKEFISVWKKVPLVTDPFKVFRGTQDPSNMMTGFISTTYYPNTHGIYNYFTDHDTKCCIYELTVNKDVRALLMEDISFFPDEFEILIDPLATIVLDDNFKLKKLDMHFRYRDEEEDELFLIAKRKTYSGEINSGNSEEYTIPGIRRNIGVISRILGRTPYTTPSIKAGKRTERSKYHRLKTRRR